MGDDVFYVVKGVHRVAYTMGKDVFNAMSDTVEFSGRTRNELCWRDTLHQVARK